jgi:hypothetical protein
MNVTQEPLRFWRLPQAWVGAILVAGGWPLNWLLAPETRRTAYLFFPLWLGYVLVMDGLVAVRSGSSLLRRSWRGFIGMFACSAPAWWLFEVLNRRTRNWEYLGTEDFSDFMYGLLCTVSFSTVMPAVFETAEWIRSFRWVERFARGPGLGSSPSFTAGLSAAGAVLLAIALLWPRLFYPLLWVSVFLLIEPINLAFGRGHLLANLQRGDWRAAVALGTGALMCGFFWELWNYYSYPKWVYHTPGLQFLHVFEMPLLGYLGYIPFAWELFSLRHLLAPQAPGLRL